jgi:hypothetical protein
MDTAEEEFLEWLDEQNGAFIADSKVEANFPDLEFQIVGTSKHYDPIEDEVMTPKRDWRRAVKTAFCG